MATEKSESFSEKQLKEFQKNNPHIQFDFDDESVEIGTPWGVEDSKFTFKLEELDSIDYLDNILLWPQFDAIIHNDKNIVEFLFGYIPKEDEDYKPLFSRKFSFNFDGKTFNCHFDQPSDRVLSLAKRYKRIPFDSHGQTAPQMLVFRDGQRVDELPKGNQNYFKDKLPLNFFLNGISQIQESDLEKIAHHLNFLMSYYDRKTPEIVIRAPLGVESKDKFIPLRFLNDAFPNNCSIDSLDDFMLQFMRIAKESGQRFSFVYYYQIIEYAGFYFLDSKAKKELRLILRDPSLVSCGEDKINQLLSFLSDLNHNDDVRMKKVIEEYCDPKIIWKEIEFNKIFFSNSVVFDGGLKLNSLCSKDTTEDAWCSMWMPKLYEHLTKIRNCIVHARERRQNIVILPTKGNTYKLSFYNSIIRRVAEQITINKE